jgi:hypothetical protein
MSKSQPTLKNPATRFIDFHNGHLEYWDKTRGEKGETVIMDFPVYFVVLDEMSTVSGFCKQANSSFYSNEVRSVVNEVLRVKTFRGGYSFTGLWKEIGARIKSMGGKFAKSVYAMLLEFNEDQKLVPGELVNFQFRGKAFSAWLDKTFDPYSYVTGITGTFQERNGNNTYDVPIFKAFTLPQDIDNAAIAMDKELQQYLKAYKSSFMEREEAEVDPEPEPREEETSAEQPERTLKGVREKAINNAPEVDDLPF